MLAYLRAQGRHGAVLGGIETGPQILAAAGLLDGHSASIHWEHYEAFRQRFPDVQAVPVLFTLEERRFTSCGLMAVADLMLALVARWVSHEMARKVAETIVHHQRSADGMEAQRLDPVQRFNIHSEVLRKAISIMQENLEKPLSTREIAKSCEIGVRQLERRFHHAVGLTPAKFYLRLRLERARHLLHYSTTPVTEVALASGFFSPSHFSKCYRQHFGVTPSGERRAGPVIGASTVIEAKTTQPE